MNRYLAGMMLMLAAGIGVAQVPGAPGRTTGANGLISVIYSPGLGTITCSGTTCSTTSSSVSPSSHSAAGVLSFNASHDANFTVGGTAGGGTGQLQVSCDGGSTWNAIVIGSGSVGGGAVSYAYVPYHCSGVTNLDTLLFRSILGGGGTTSAFNMLFTSPSSVVIAW